MKKYILILIAFIGSFTNAQGYDFQQLCLNCAEQNGFYCGDDPANTGRTRVGLGGTN